MTKQWACRWVGAYHKMFPLKLSNVGQAFQPEDSKNTISIAPDLHMLKLFSLVYMAYIFFSFFWQPKCYWFITSLHLLQWFHPPSLFYVCMCVKFKFILQPFTCAEDVNIASSTLKNVVKISKLQNRLQINQRSLTFNQEMQRILHYHKVFSPVH